MPRKSERHPCPHDGCPAEFGDASAAKGHAARPHALCTCGRSFEAVSGIMAHKRQVLSKGIPHVPFADDTPDVSGPEEIELTSTTDPLHWQAENLLLAVDMAQHKARQYQQVVVVTVTVVNRKLQFNLWLTSYYLKAREDATQFNQHALAAQVMPNGTWEIVKPFTLT